MLKNILQLIEQKSKNPISFLISIISGMVVLLSAIKGIYVFIKQIPYPLNYIALTILIACTLISILIFLLIFSYPIKYKIPYLDRYILTNVKQTCHFDLEGKRHFSQEKTFFFTEQPKESDFFDNQLSYKGFSFKDFRYSSTDSTITYIDEESSKNICKIYWKPISGQIKKAVPYTHKFQCIYPKQKLNNPKLNNMNFITISTSAYIQNFWLEISSEREIIHTVAYKKPWGISLKDPDKIISYAKQIRKTNCPPLITSASGNLIWQHEELSRGDMYFIVIEFKS